MSVILVDGLSLSFGSKVLFDDVGFAVGAKDRVGLVGANGTGKSSLLKVLAGVTMSDSGSVRYSRKARAGYLPQDVVALPDGNLLSSVMGAVPGRDALQARLAEVERALPQSSGEQEQLELAQELSDLHEELDHFDAHYGRHHAERILVGLGFRENDFEKPTTALSGGWRMRAALAGLLLQDPDVLLLDEPTNHLDLPTLAWFDEFLKRSRKALVLISHDRDFLNRHVGRILALEVEGLREYTGNFDRYRQQRTVELEGLRARAARQAAKREEMEAFIERFGAKASKARQAQSRAKMLEKEEVIEVHEERQAIRFQFPDVVRSSRDVVALEGLSKTFGELKIYQNLSARLERGQRVAVVGLNGAGKSTLLKLVAGELDPDAGDVKLGDNVVMGYYAQHHADTLNPRSSILGEVQSAAPDKNQSYWRGILGAFLFSGDDVDKPIGVLSGGERARVALAKLLLKPANLLLMDEPTNHLDLDSSEALIEALEGYGGTLLFVSHNRSFLNRLATHVWEVKDGQVTPYPGNLDDYLFHLSQKAQGTWVAESEKPSEAAPLRDKDRKRAEAEERNRRYAVEGPIRKEIAAIEKEVASLEEAQKTREAQLADPQLYNDFAKAKPIMDAHRDGKAQLETLYARWEDAQGRLEQTSSDKV